MFIATDGLKRSHRGRRGQVMVMALLALLLLGGMVFYVYNVGDQVNRRALVQTSADSAAISGATWMARSMNVIAMNNVAQTRLITMVPVLDSVPQATEMSYLELKALIDTINAQLERGVPDDYVRTGLTNVRDRFERQLEVLQPVYDALVTGGYDVRELTYWRDPNGGSSRVPYGQLWAGAKALEDYNTATYESSGYLSQFNAWANGRSCLAHDSQEYDKSMDATAFLAPLLPRMPAKIGQFQDFQKPVMEGRPPEYYTYPAGDFIRRGPYDRLYKWRDPKYDWTRTEVIATNREFVQGTSGPIRGNRGTSSGSNDTSSGQSVARTNDDYWKESNVTRMVYGPQTGWNTYGPFTWALFRPGLSRSSGLPSYATQNLKDSKFLQQLQALSQAKMAYIWGGAARNIHVPKWITDYEEAKEWFESGRPVKYTMLYMVETKSRIAPGEGGYRNPGTYKDSDAEETFAQRKNGWADPDKFRAGPGEASVRQCKYIWTLDKTYQTTYDESIGLPHPPAGAEPTWHNVYLREVWVFGGIDVGADEPIRNPANWTGDDERPRPWVLDLDRADYRSDGERQYLSFLGVARMSNKPGLWSGKFQDKDSNPYRNAFAVAESHVFNNISWDLWTQDWQARMRPVSTLHWPTWATLPAGPDMGGMGGGTPYEELVSELVSADELAKARQALGSFGNAMVSQLKTQ